VSKCKRCVPTKANYYTCVVLGKEDDTTYNDRYTCTLHTPDPLLIPKTWIPEGYEVLEVEQERIR
jgi:hypothetical protein